ncbi:MAG TPA: class I SAM-dependent methyltransferase [Gemmatimonadales bacterium]|nr:class I SAM-dependent methyltransferase [Gemmatimonadales bacterium]
MGTSHSTVLEFRKPRASPPRGGPAARAARAILTSLFGPPGERDFAVRLWDGTVDRPGTAGKPRFTLVFNHPAALRRMLLPPSETRAARAYLRGDIDVEGDLERATALADRLASRLGSPGACARLLARLLALPRTAEPREGAGARHFAARRARLHAPKTDRAAVRFHYDVGNDFYRLWLDRRMVYSCGYFPTGAEDIDAAQEAKLDHICRKLRLAPGERFLDIGCGWGALVMHAAERYGVNALGITLSRQQAAYAGKAIAAAGLAGRCRVAVCDYRELASGGPTAEPLSAEPVSTEPLAGAFDKVASVGMFEHVGRRMLPTYFAEAFRLTRPGGLFLNHGIVQLAPRGARPMVHGAARLLWHPGRFIERYVFPGGELVPAALAVHCGEEAGFELRDGESLREHYALTLRQWVRRLEAHAAEARELVGEPTYRVWKLYMAGSARAFAAARIGLVQLLFAKPDGQGGCPLPLNRSDLYRDSPRLVH